MDENISKDLSTISALSDRIEKIVRDLRHLTKPAKPAFKSLDLGRLLRSTVEMMENTTGTLRGFKSTPDAPLRLIIEVDDNLPMILGEAHGLESAIINMLLNSAHAIREKGSGTLRLAVRRLGDTLDLVVEDTGCGIKPEILPHVFEPYFTTRSDAGGTGIGMCILQNVADIHNARVDVQSEWGVGTRITVRFPVAKAQNAPAY